MAEQSGKQLLVSGKKEQDTLWLCLCVRERERMR